MKRFLELSVLLILVFLSLDVQAEEKLGFRCKDLSIYRVLEEPNDRIEIRKVSGEVLSVVDLELPSGNSVDAYQTRYGTYYQLRDLSQERFPYAPEFIRVAWVIQSSHLYRKGFDAFEGRGEAPSLGQRYCRALVDTLLRK